MANTIKLKRGSGSDPSASDLSVGEIAIRTDSGKLFTKKDNGTVAEISGSGGGLEDGDKGDITVSNGGDTFTIDNGVVTSAKIADGTIVNADISGSAAIAGSKLQAAGLVNAGSMSAANFNKLAGIEANATADMTGTEILSTISGENIILGEIASTGNSTFAGNVTISSSDGGSAAAPELDLYRISASPADADYLGQIKFSGEDAADNKQVYAKITGKAGDVTNTTEDGILEFMLVKAGSNNIAARFTSTDLKLINGTGLEVAGETDLSELLTVTRTSSSGSDPILKALHSNLSQGIALGYNTISAIGSNTNVDLNFEAKGSGHINMKDNLDCEAGLDVIGNIGVSGTVDGVNIATRDTLFGALTSSSGVLTDGVTATTQSAGNNTTRVATTAFVSTAIANLIDSSPSTLNTLNELAAALGDDPNFATTVTNSIATKLPLAGGTLTGDLTVEHSGHPTILIHDTSGDNQVKVQFQTDSYSWSAGLHGGENKWKVSKSSTFGTNDYLEIDTNGNLGISNNISVGGLVDGRDVASDGSKLDTIESNATADQTASEILTLIKTVDGSGSGLDADTLDGVQASGLVAVGGDTMTGNLRVDISSNVDGILGQAFNNYFGLRHADQTQNSEYMILSNNSHTFISATSGNQVRIRYGGNDSTNELQVGSGNDALTWRGNKIFHAGNDGAGSGLDADTLDGVSSASFLRSDANDTSSGTIAFGTGNLDPDSFSSHSGGFGNIADGGGWTARGLFVHGGGTGDAAAIAHNGSKLYFGIQNNSSANSMATWLDVTPSSRIINFQTADNANNVRIGGNKIFHAGNDGSGSGLDADLLDGVQGSNYLRSDQADTMSGNFSLEGNLLLTGTATTTNQERRINFTGFDKESTNDFTDNAFIRHTTNEGGHSGSVLEIGSLNDSNDGIAFKTHASSQLKHNGYTIWDANNDGSGSGLDADLLDGQQGSHYLDYNNFSNTPTIPTNNNQLTNGAGYITATLTNEQVQDIVGGMVSSNTESGITVTYQDGDGTLDFSVASQTDNNFTNADHSKLDGIEANATADQTASEILTLLKTVDGAGSGLDADTLDGVQATGFFRQSGSWLGDLGSHGFTRENGLNMTGGAEFVVLSKSGQGHVLIDGTYHAYEGGGFYSYQNSNFNNEIGFYADSTTSAKWTGHLKPNGDSTYDLGSSSLRWTNVYADNLYGSGANITAINASNISSGTIASARIADDAITTAKIADGAVNTDRLAGSAVNSTRLADNAVTTSKISNNSVTNAKINSMAASKLTGALPAIDGSALTGISAGATGGGSDEVFYENDQTVTTDYTITNGKNAMAAGPITISNGATITVGSGETLTIV